MMCQTYYLPRDTVFNLYIQDNSLSCPSYAFPSPHTASCTCILLIMPTQVWCTAYSTINPASRAALVHVYVAQVAEHCHRNKSGGCVFHYIETWWLRVLFNFARFLLSIYDDRKKHHLNQHSEIHTELP